MVLALEVVEYPDDVAMLYLVHYADFGPDLTQHVLLLDLELVDLFYGEYTTAVLVGGAVHLPVGTLFLC